VEEKNYMSGEKIIIGTFCLLGIWILCSFCGCAQEKERKLRLATTSSVENSGLLDTLLPEFERKYGVKVQVMAVGTGRALELASAGDADVVIVHAPEAEQKFLKSGFGINRKTLFFNYFLLLGPPSDPIGTKESQSAQAAFVKIAESESLFVSRGDNSGTHIKEQQIWQKAALKPKGPWYLETGQGMGPSLLIADEKKAYILSDRGTYLSYQKKLEIEPVYAGQDEILYNPYSIIATNPAKQASVNYDDALTLINWLASDEGQSLVGEYRLDNQVLFHPLTTPEEEGE
jgi:tungstate transport system substrate-binding protein